MTMYFRSLFPSACPIGHNGWLEIRCPICRLYFFRDWTYIYDNVHPISIPNCFYDQILYIRIEIGCPICKVDFFRDRIDFHEYVFLSLLPRACSIGPNMAYRDRISDLYSISLHRTDRSVIYKGVCQIAIAVFYLISHISYMWRSDGSIYSWHAVSIVLLYTWTKINFWSCFIFTILALKSLTCGSRLFFVLYSHIWHWKVLNVV